jgi:putative nucleotidyltransferase with HDIG domain
MNDLTEGQQLERLLRDFPLAAELPDALRGPVLRVWREMWTESDWALPTDCPYNPVAPEVDLVTHVNQVTIGALRLAEVATDTLGVDAELDVVRAAGLLHDASKLVEYEPGPDGMARKSPYGKEHQHAVLAAERSTQAGLPDAVVDIIRNHTPQSSEVPETIEGLCIYYADMCAADVARLEGGADLIVARHKPPAK